MAPTEAMEPGNDGLSKTRLQEILTRLRAVRRRCGDGAGVGGRRNQAEEGLDAIIADLDECLKLSNPPIAAEDLDLRLAAVEELFESTGSPGLGGVVANIRGRLATPTEDPSEEEEPPPPRRFQPSPASAVRRRRPRPRTARRPAQAATRKGGFGWLKLTILVGAAVAAAAFVYLQRAEPEIEPPKPSDRATVEEPVASRVAPPPPPTTVPEPSNVEDGFEPDEEEMASFTLEIRLAESTLSEGDVSESLRHFAAAAAIDRHHRRVLNMGKSLIAALLHEADVAHDRGDRELAGKRVQNARNIARGLRLDDSAIDKTALKHASMTRFEDITPRDGQALQRAIGHPVRLTLKTQDVIFGHLNEIQDDILILDVYSGVKGGGVEFSTSILASTIRELRVYDAKRPEEIMTGD